MRVLVCGSRDWSDELILNVVLDGLRMRHGTIVVIHGAARGADKLADEWAKYEPMPRLPFPANWDRDGRYTAGPIRNQRMLDEAFPELVIAFKDGLRPALDKGGTEDMVRRAKAAGIPVYVVSHG